MTQYVAKFNFDAGDGEFKAGQVYTGGQVKALLEEGLIEELKAVAADPADSELPKASPADSQPPRKSKK
jgi:hypothetical protein